MKKLMALFLSLLSLNCFAEGVLVNHPTCPNFPQENLGGCIQNKTNQNIGDGKLFVVVQKFLKTGTIDTAAAVIQPFLSNNYVAVSWSKDKLIKANLNGVRISLTRYNKLLPNCVVDIHLRSDKKSPTFFIRGPITQMHC